MELRAQTEGSLAAEVNMIVLDSLELLVQVRHVSARHRGNTLFIRAATLILSYRTKWRI